MTMSTEIRWARELDMASCASIVNHYIETTAVNFRTAPQTAAEWRDDWELLRDRYPWLVAADASQVVGLAYAGPWKPRDAYRWSAETTVYVAHGLTRRGVGRLLYDRLLQTLDAQGYRSAIGVIAQPNAASVALHEAFGFRHAGTLEAAGFKHGQWRDVGFWQRLSPSAGSAPGELLPVASVRE